MITVKSGAILESYLSVLFKAILHSLYVNLNSVSKTSIKVLYSDAYFYTLL